MKVPKKAKPAPANKKTWSFKNKSEAVGELMLYGDISSSTWWGDEVTPKQFKQDMDALGDISTLNVYINSDGGDVFAGQAIYSMLKRHTATKNVYIDGLAASIASLIAMAGDKVIIPANAMMMIHNPASGVWGNANEMREMADALDKIREAMLVTYETKTGMKETDLITLLDAETWLTAQEAVDYGFADEVEETKQIAASLRKGNLVMNGQEFDLDRFTNAPKFELPAEIQDPPQTSAVKNAGRTLSADNEALIRQAQGLLDEVLDQLDDPNEDEDAEASRRQQELEARAQEKAKKVALLALELAL